jgi:short-subunit dehydrogenase
LAARGLNLVLIARREGPLATLAEQIHGEFKVDCVIASVDLAKDDASAWVIEAVGSREVGLLINNAGGDTSNAFFLDAELEVWEKLRAWM